MYYPKIPYYKLKDRTSAQHRVVRRLEPSISLEQAYHATQFSLSGEPSKSTIDAYEWLNKFHPEKAPDWLARHPGFKVPT